MSLKNEIYHDQQAQRFTLPADGGEAVLDYQVSNGSHSGQPATVNFIHTYVPPELRGQGLAESLVRYGLAWAKKQNYDIRASCWYVAKFLR